MFEQEKYLKRYKRHTVNTTSPMITDRIAPKAISQSFTITDEHWKDMWYLVGIDHTSMKHRQFRYCMGGDRRYRSAYIYT